MAHVLDTCLNNENLFVYVASAFQIKILSQSVTLRFKINGGGRSFFRDFCRFPPQLILTPPFINFFNFTRDYKEVRKYIIDG